MSKEKTKPDNTELTPQEKAFQDQQKTRWMKVKVFSKRLKWYHILISVILLAIIMLFVIWHLSPKKKLEVAVLDKTVLSYADDDKIIKENVVIQ